MSCRSRVQAPYGPLHPNNAAAICILHQYPSLVKGVALKMPCVSFAGSNPAWCTWKAICHKRDATARLAQSVEREALNLVVVGSSPTVGTYRSLVMPATKDNLLVNKRCGAEEACRAHNPKVSGSKPLIAKNKNICIY